MYRAVITQALQDVGYGTDDDRSEVQNWTNSAAFPTVCELAQWDSAWIRDILLNALRLGPGIRKPVIKESLDILRGIRRLLQRSESDTAPTYGFPIASEAILREDLRAEGRMLVSKLSTMSKKLWEKKRTDGDN